MRILAGVLLLAPSLVFADAKMIQISKDGRKGAIRFANIDVAVGDVFIVEEETGNCSVYVSKIKPPTAIVDTQDCLNPHSIKKNAPAHKRAAAGMATAKKQLGEDFVPSQALYLPGAGKTLAQVTFAYSSESYEVLSDTFNVVTEDRTVSGTKFNLLAGYGVTRDLSANISLSYMSAELESKPTPTFGGATSTAKVSGLDDPAFALYYRYMNQSVHGFELTPFVSYSPSFIAAESASANKEGNVARGGGLTMLGIQGGKRFGALTAGAMIRYSLYSDREIKNAETKIKYEKSGGNTFGLAGHGEYFFSPSFYTGVEALFENASMNSTKNTSTGVVTDEDSATHMTFTGKASFGFERIWLSGFASYLTISDTRFKSTQTYMYRDRSGYALGLSVSAEF